MSQHGWVTSFKAWHVCSRREWRVCRCRRMQVAQLCMHFGVHELWSELFEHVAVNMPITGQRGSKRWDLCQNRTTHTKIQEEHWNILYSSTIEISSCNHAVYEHIRQMDKTVHVSPNAEEENIRRFWPPTCMHSTCLGKNCRCHDSEMFSNLLNAHEYTIKCTGLTQALLWRVSKMMHVAATSMPTEV